MARDEGLVHFFGMLHVTVTVVLPCRITQLTYILNHSVHHIISINTLTAQVKLVKKKLCTAFLNLDADNHDNLTKTLYSLAASVILDLPRPQNLTSRPNSLHCAGQSLGHRFLGSKNIFSIKCEGLASYTVLRLTTSPTAWSFSVLVVSIMESLLSWIQPYCAT